MNLQDAIREGCTTTLPGYGKFICVNDDGNVEACAIGAALIGSGNEEKQLKYAALWPELADMSDPPIHDCPACDGGGSLYFVITQLNDIHRWSREATADWIETLSIDLTPAAVVRERIPV